MRLNVAELDQERFSVQTREHPVLGTVQVVTPDKAMFDWNLDELHLRSLVVKDGEVISAGFPKFFNYGEIRALDERTSRILSEHPERVRLTAKVDGSLIIRSVVDGQVYLRTRGSHELGDFEEPVMGLLRERYPLLLDPAFDPPMWETGPGMNLLFEYCGPDNQIVIRYSEPKLWALGATAFDSRDSLIVHPFDPGHARQIGVDVLPTFSAPTSVEDIRSRLSRLEQEEGYVAWIQEENGDWHLTKFKTAWYLKLHALRTQASPRFIKEYCLQHNCHDVDRFKIQLSKDGFDWEVVSYLEPSYKEFEFRWREVQRTIDDFDELCEGAAIPVLAEAGDRKALALAIKAAAAEAEHEWLFHYGIMKYTDKKEAAEELVQAQILEIGANEFRNLKKAWP